MFIFAVFCIVVIPICLLTRLTMPTPDQAKNRYVGYSFALMLFVLVLWVGRYSKRVNQCSDSQILEERASRQAATRFLEENASKPGFRKFLEMRQANGFDKLQCNGECVCVETWDNWLSKTKSVEVYTQREWALKESVESQSAIEQPYQ